MRRSRPSRRPNNKLGGTVKRQTNRWAETIVAAALNDRDVEPILHLAERAGVDLDELGRLVNCVFDAVQQHLAFNQEPEALFSVDDLAELRKLGIAGE